MPWTAATKLGGQRVATARFKRHQFRGVKLEICPALPQLGSDLLMRRHDQVAVGPGREITDHRGFDVDARFHLKVQ